MRILRPIVQALVRTMLDAGHDLPLRRTMGSKLVGDHNAGQNLALSEACASTAWQLWYRGGFGPDRMLPGPISASNLTKPTGLIPP